MTGARTRLTLVLGVGIVMGVMVGLLVSGNVAAFVSPWRARAATSDTGTKREPRPRPDPNVVTLEDTQLERLKTEPVQLRSFREERTAIGRIAFTDERTTAIFAPFQGRVLRLPSLTNRR